MRKRVRIGIIGAGRIGRVHLENIAHHIPEATPCVVGDVAGSTAQSIAQEFGVSRSVIDYRAVVEDEDVDAVVICTPTESHVAVIEAAAAAGKHIFCEKPIARTLAEIDRALQVIEGAGVHFQVGFNRRFDPSFRRVREAVECGEIGEPHLLHITSRDPAPPPLDYLRGSGGLFFDMTIHDFDMARYLIGSEVDEIYATGANLVDPAIGEAGDIDTAVVLLRFRNGVMGTIDNSRGAVYGYDQRVEVFGAGGSVRSENPYPNSVRLADSRNVRRDLPLHFFVERYAESYRAEMQAFIEAILLDEPVAVGGRDGRSAALLSLAAQRSYVERRPVSVPEIESVPLVAS